MANADTNLTLLLILYRFIPLMIIMFVVSDHDRQLKFFRLRIFTVVNEKLRCPADSLPLVLNRAAALQAGVHFTSSLLLSCILTWMIGGRYTDLVIYCDEQENR